MALLTLVNMWSVIYTIAIIIPSDPVMFRIGNTLQVTDVVLYKEYYGNQHYQVSNGKNDNIFL